MYFTPGGLGHFNIHFPAVSEAVAVDNAVCPFLDIAKGLVDAIERQFVTIDMGHQGIRIRPLESGRHLIDISLLKRFHETEISGEQLVDIAGAFYVYLCWLQNHQNMLEWGWGRLSREDSSFSSITPECLHPSNILKGSLKNEMTPIQKLDIQKSDEYVNLQAAISLIERTLFPTAQTSDMSPWIGIDVPKISRELAQCIFEINGAPIATDSNFFLRIHTREFDAIKLFDVVKSEGYRVAKCIYLVGKLLPDGDCVTGNDFLDIMGSVNHFIESTPGAHDMA